MLVKLAGNFAHERTAHSPFWFSFQPLYLIRAKDWNVCKCLLWLSRYTRRNWRENDGWLIWFCVMGSETFPLKIWKNSQNYDVRDKFECIFLITFPKSFLNESNFTNFYNYLNEIAILTWTTANNCKLEDCVNSFFPKPIIGTTSVWTFPIILLWLTDGPFRLLLLERKIIIQTNISLTNTPLALLYFTR